MHAYIHTTTLYIVTHTYKYILTYARQNSYTLTVAATSLLLNIYHMARASGARKAAGIPYPNPYATAEQAEKDPKAFAFNCAQRA